jgi:hypothetical protein
MSRYPVVGAPPARAGGVLRALLTLALALGAMSSAPAALPAQLTFAPPAAPANVAGYRHVDECLVASARVRDSVDSWGGLLADTLAAVDRRKPQASLAPSRDVARRCADNIEQGDGGLADFAPWFELYLRAGRDDRAEALLERRLAAIAPAAVAERVAVLDSVVSIAVQLRPARLVMAERALDLRDQHDSIVPPTKLYMSPFGLMLQAQIVGEREAAIRAAQRMVRLDERATPATRERAIGRVQMLFMARTLISMDSALAALRTQGTDAYVAIRRDSWARASGELPEALAIPIGEPAAEVEADVWIGERDGDGPRPTKGRVSLLLFIPTRCDDRCPTGIATLRRIVERFPELQVTLMASTEGQVNPLLTPTVAEEAAVLRETLVACHRLPGAIAVEDAHPWYLPAPDGRRIEMPTPNEEAYGFGQVAWFAGRFSAFVVDREGTIIEHQMLGNPVTGAVTEDIMTTIIEILFAGQDGTAGGAR